ATHHSPGNCSSGRHADFEPGGESASAKFPHVRGTISMARASALDSASSQFFIGLDTNAVQPLDGRFAAFGGLLGGFDTLDAIQQGSRIFTAKVVGGIVPGRVSTIITDPVLLNNSVNAINIASLGLSFRDFTNGNDNVTLTPEDTLFNLSGIRAFDGNDTVVGSNEIDYINGNQGNDSLSGRLGNDYIRGGRDADNIFGEEGDDILNGNIGNDIVNGGSGNDFVRGGQDNDILIGGAGNDVLVGDFGSDVLTGNAGADTFVLRVVTAGTDPLLADFVTDFNVAEGDRILVAGDISPTALTFLPIGNGTQIQLTATAQVLGVVENIPAATVQAATIVTLTGDAALRVG
ncbi:MAG: peptidylprolyl isomerase, partial [Coleofasciculaceae cyanobacterium SM2_3_26]|nr:peptidylprolyl isomerase [Coleofasciculaceae cyanobacterium SM2_3_26]